MLYKRILPFIIALLTFPGVMQAQVTTSSMTGLVTNTENEPLIGATISAIHVPTGTKYTTVSRQGGSYTIPNMRSGGPYIVQVTYVGYSMANFEDVNLRLAETFILNAVLQKSTGSLENVTVVATGRNNILNANRKGAATNIGIREIQSLPTINRSLNDLTRMAPQANGSSIGGGNYRSNYITVDGSDFNNTFGIGTNLPAGGSPISLDALAEISVNVTPYDVRQSGFTGASVNAVTRSGTNNPSGTAYYYWRSEKQQGGKVGDVSFTKNPFEFKLYGGSFGFPIIPNKLFAFVNYEYDQSPKQVNNRVASTPSNPFNATTNLSVARPTFDSLTLISNYLQKTYGYTTGDFQGYSTNITHEKFLARIDWNINKNNRFNIRYNQVEGGEPNPPSTSRTPLQSYNSSTSRTSIYSLWYQNSNYFQGANFYSLAAELNSVITPRLANTLRGTYTFQNDSRQTTSSQFPFVDILSGGLTTSAGSGTPYTSFGYEPFSFGNLRKVKTFSVVDNITFTLNNHQITAGVQFDKSEVINGFQRFATSYYTFASWSDFVNGQKPLDFGITYSLLPGYQQAYPRFVFKQYSGYIQDEIAVTKKLRVAAGLRVDVPTFPGVLEVKTHPLVAGLTFANGTKVNTGQLPSSKPIWSPRAGFNWDIHGDRSLQLRGGTGIFSGRIPFVWIVSQVGDAGMLQVTQFYETSGAARTSGNPSLYATPGPFNTDPRAYLPATQPAAGTVISSPTDVLDPNFKFPQTWKSSLAFDKRLGGGFILTVEGIWNKDLHTPYFSNVNLVDPSPLNIAGYADNRLVYPVNVRDRNINPLTSAGLPVPNGDTRAGTAQYNVLVLSSRNKGYSGYLTVQLQKQFNKGLWGSIAWTGAVGDNLFDGSGDQPLSAWQDTRTVNGTNYPTLTPNGNILPNRVTAFVSYKKEYLRHLATTLTLAYQGAIQDRFSYTYSSDFNRDGANADLIYIPKDATDTNQIKFADKTVSGVLYPAAKQGQMFNDYINQDPYLSKHRGEYAERNGAKYPWRNQLDFKLLQDVFVNLGNKKRNTVQFSLDIFNFGNLINSKWGTFRSVNASSILVPTSTTTYTAGGTVKPTFQLATVGTGLATNTFSTVTTVGSTYYMEFGLRYIFN